MRVNHEDEAITDGVYTHIANLMGWRDLTAYGAVGLFWRDTQKACVIEAGRLELERFAERRMLPEEAPRFIEAMRRAELLLPVRVATWVPADGEIFMVRGNRKHVVRISKLRAISQAGGKARASQMATRTATHNQATTQPQPSAPYSLLLTPSKILDHGGVVDPISDPQPTEAQSTHPPFAGERIEIRMIEAEHSRLVREKHGVELPAYGPQEARDAATLLRRVKGEWQKMLEKFIAFDSDYYRKMGWPLSLMLKDLNKIAVKKEVSIEDLAF